MSFLERGSAPDLQKYTKVEICVHLSKWSTLELNLEMKYKEKTAGPRAGAFYEARPLRFPPCLEIFRPLYWRIYGNKSFTGLRRKKEEVEFEARIGSHSKLYSCKI